MNFALLSFWFPPILNPVPATINNCEGSGLLTQSCDWTAPHQQAPAHSCFHRWHCSAGLCSDIMESPVGTAPSLSPSPSPKPSYSLLQKKLEHPKDWICWGEHLWYPKFGPTGTASKEASGSSQPRLSGPSRSSLLLLLQSLCYFSAMQRCRHCLAPPDPG